MRRPTTARRTRPSFNFTQQVPRRPQSAKVWGRTRRAPARPTAPPRAPASASAPRHTGRAVRNPETLDVAYSHPQQQAPPSSAQKPAAASRPPAHPRSSQAQAKPKPLRRKTQGSTWLTDIGQARCANPMKALPMVITEAAIKEAGFAGASNPLTDWAVEVRPLPLNATGSAARQNRAFRHRVQGDLTGAIREYTKALNSDPGNFKARFNRGFMYLKGNMYQRALDDFVGASEVEPDNCFALYNIAVCLLAMKNYDEAVEYLTLAIEADNTLSMFYRARGWTNRKRGDFVTAIKDYIAAKALDAKGTAVVSTGLTTGDDAAPAHSMPKHVRRPSSARRRPGSAASSRAGSPRPGSATSRRPASRLSRGSRPQSARRAVTRNSMGIPRQRRERVDLDTPSHRLTQTQLDMRRDYRQTAKLNKGNFNGVTLFYGNGPLFHPPEFKPSEKVVTSADVRKRCREILTMPAASRTADHIDFLMNLTANCRLFSSLAPLSAEALCRQSGITETAHGRIVYRQGDAGASFLLILAGSVSVYLDRMPTLEETVKKVTAAMKVKARARALVSGAQERLAKKLQQGDASRSSSSASPAQVSPAAAARAAAANASRAAAKERSDMAAKVLALRGSSGYMPGIGSRIGVLYAGDGFGAMDVLEANGQRAVTVVTNEPCAFLTVSRAAYLRVLLETQTQAHEELYHFLKASRLFRGCPEDELRQLVQGAKREKYLSGCTIAKQGEVLPGVYFVEQGRCTVYKRMRQGMAATLAGTLADTHRGDKTSTAGGKSLGHAALQQLVHEAELEAQGKTKEEEAAELRSEEWGKGTSFLLQQAAKHRIVDLKYSEGKEGGKEGSDNLAELGTLLPRDAFGEDSIVNPSHRKRGHHRGCLASGTLKSSTNVVVVMIPKEYFFTKCSFATRETMRQNCDESKLASKMKTPREKVAWEKYKAATVAAARAESAASSRRGNYLMRR